MSDPGSTTRNRAIFLSYAREDAGIAQPIAEALRRAGAEVWFDQSELRGGDSWDQKIRREIKDCALFIPIISATTQSRPEGYFRREWRQAADRTRDMASGITFILPVVVDDTREDRALVPEEFMLVQWTRLPEALPTAEFVRQVKSLLESPREAKTATPFVSKTSPQPAIAKPATSGGTQKWVLAAAAFAIVTIGAWWLLHEPARPASEPAPAVAAPPSALTKMGLEKSIAVLPFTNMSEDKDTGFFADGVHEDLLTNLALVPELKVISRTSVLQYRGTTKTMRQIGQELHVAYILEGSVRRSGNRVRVTGQLIKTGTDEHVWAKNYDRELTDIFAIQSALSQEIAGALSAAITPETKKQLERKRTENMAAYELFLKARDDYNKAPRGNSLAMRKSEQMFQAVVEMDPKFAEAWGELAVLHALYVFWGLDATPERLAKGEAAITRARELAPDSPEIIGDIGTYAYYAHRDYALATAQYAALAKMQPNDPSMHHSLGLILRRQGRWAESYVEMKRAVLLEPSNYGYIASFSEMCYHLRRWDEVRALRRRMEEMKNNDLSVRLFTALNVESSITGSMAAFEKLWASLTPAEKALPTALMARKHYAIWMHDESEFRRLDALVPKLEEEEEPFTSANDAAVFLWVIGDKKAATARIAPFVDEIRQLAENQPSNPIAQESLSNVQFLMGETEAALVTARRTMQLLPISADAMDGTNYEYGYYATCAVCGRGDEALAGLERLIRLPSLIPPEAIRHDEAFAALRGNPRFQALFTNPENLKAPLY